MLRGQLLVYLAYDHLVRGVLRLHAVEPHIFLLQIVAVTGDDIFNLLLERRIAAFLRVLVGDFPERLEHADMGRLGKNAAAPHALLVHHGHGETGGLGVAHPADGDAAQVDYLRSRVLLDLRQRHFHVLGIKETQRLIILRHHGLHPADKAGRSRGQLSALPLHVRQKGFAQIRGVQNGLHQRVLVVLLQRRDGSVLVGSVIVIHHLVELPQRDDIFFIVFVYSVRSRTTPRRSSPLPGAAS